MKTIKIVIGVLVILGLCWFGYSYYRLQKTVTDMMNLQQEQVDVELQVPTTSANDFVKSVYYAIVQLNAISKQQSITK